MSFAKHIKELNRKIIYNTPELLGQYSQYKLDKVFYHYSTDYIESYTLIHGNASQSNNTFYCLVHKLPQIIDFSRFIRLYNLEHISNLLNIVDYGITKFKDQEIFGLILPYLPPENLLCNNLQLLTDSPDIILQSVIMPILQTLVQLHNADLTHGCINQENIWLNINQKDEISGMILSNSILDLPGYNQNPIYEPINRMLVNRAGKSPSKSADCYAVGILLASLLANKNITRKGYETTVRARAKYGSYQSIINQYFNGNEDCLDETQRCILYWLLHDDQNKRWSAIDALKFLRRRHRSVTRTNILKIISQDKQYTSHFKTPLTFSGEECYSMTEAAVSSIRHYDDIKILVKNGKLIKELLGNNAIKPDFISKISILRLLDGFEGNKFFSKEDMFLTTFIILMDQSMPIKLKDITMEANAVWQLSKYLATYPAASLSNKAIHLNIFTKIQKLISSICNVKIDSIDIPNLTILDYLSEDIIRNIMYSYIEPNSVFILNGKICFTISDVLEIFNTLDDISLLEIAEDNRFIGYIIGKVIKHTSLNFKNNIVLNNIEDRFALFLSILSECYKINSKKPLHNLSNALYKKLANDYLDKVSNLKLQKKLNNRLQTAVAAGDIMQMHNIMQSKEIDIMHKKYLKVIKKITKLNQQINEMPNTQAIIDQSRQYTIRLAACYFIIVLCFILYQIS